MLLPVIFLLQYPQSNIRVIMTDVLKLVEANGGAKQLMSRYIELDPDDAGYVSEKTFRFGFCSTPPVVIF